MLPNVAPSLYGVSVARNPNVVPDPQREGQHAFLCPEPGCGFVSDGWSTIKGATERGSQHLVEHETGEPSPELAESGIAGAVQEG